MLDGSGALWGAMVGLSQPCRVAHRGRHCGVAVGSIALTGWALGGGYEGLASAMVL
ncbi:hypothetical protein [Mycobacterium leprae]|uniref:hypothetical protein n=1 Tax=Mycobacterium leprae TaxID=1769 RepID=UPI000A7AE93D